jgi:NTE family protein
VHGVVDEIRFPGSRASTRIAAHVPRHAARRAVRPGALRSRPPQALWLGDFEHVDYQIFEEAGKQIVSVSAIEKSWGPDYVRFGLGLQSDFKGANYFNLAASYRRTWENALGAEWRTDVQMGQVGFLTTEWYQPLGTRNGLFIAPRATIVRRNLDVYRDSDRIARYDLSTYYGSLDVGRAFTRYGEVRVGVAFGRSKATLDTGPPELEPTPSSIRARRSPSARSSTSSTTRTFRTMVSRGASTSSRRAPRSAHGTITRAGT